MNSSATMAIRRRWEGTFFGMMTLLMAAVVFAGFGRSFFLRPWFPEIEPHAAPETYFYIHGTAFAAWMALMVVQPMLIRTRRRRLHFTLGWIGAGLAAAMVPLGIYGAVIAARREGGFIDVPESPKEFLLGPIVEMLLFAGFVGLAILWRRDGQSHKRLMIFATLSLLNAAFIRIPLNIIQTGGHSTLFFFTDTFIVFLVLWDIWSLRRIHPVTLWAGLAFLISQPLRVWGGGTTLWLDFAQWFVGS